MENKDFNPEWLDAFKDAYKKSEYIKRSWVTIDNLTMTLAQYAKYVNPKYKHVALEEKATIISIKKKDGGSFLKMAIPLTDGNIIEYELSYEEHDFVEGDEFDPASLLFCMETFLDEKHAYVTGEAE